MRKFFINGVGDQGGPNIFASRLKDALCTQGMDFFIPDPYTHSQRFSNLAIIQGIRFPNAKNILRLDGLYFDSENEANDNLNRGAFDCYFNFDHVIFQSEFSRDMYEAFTTVKKPHSVISNGVPDYFSPSAKPSESPPGYEKVCLASASWRRHKRLEEAVEAFRSPALKDVCLVVLGGAEYDLKQEIPENVFLKPRIPPEDLPGYYTMADAMIHLSWLDWCPNTVVESLACGTPVLCSSNGGTKELVKDNGVVIQLEESYNIGEKVPLYNPPKVDSQLVVEGILKVLNESKGFTRKDLSIEEVAKKYSKVMI